MQRSVYYAEVVVALDQGGIYADALDGIQVGFIDLLTYDLDQCGVTLELDVLNLYLGNLIAL